MPPLQALVALHGLWAIFLLPFAIWAVRKWPPLRLEVAGYALSAVGLLAFAVLSGRELLTWYPAVLPSQQQYIAQRILYVLGTNTDLPTVQVLLTGIAFWFAGRRRRPSAAARRRSRGRQ
jgi:hypothetical protein